MKIQNLPIEGCLLADLPRAGDKRGHFVKTFNVEMLDHPSFQQFQLAEEFCSFSNENVLRGLHFQTPPAAHNKIVTCLVGSVSDFFLDIRQSSSTYMQHMLIPLCSSSPQLLYLPKGIAHGFVTESTSAMMLYKTDHVYSPDHDTGVLWSSIDLGLPARDYIISERDRGFPDIENFTSHFV